MKKMTNSRNSRGAAPKNWETAPDLNWLDFAGSSQGHEGEAHDGNRSLYPAPGNCGGGKKREDNASWHPPEKIAFWYLHRYQRPLLHLSKERPIHKIHIYIYRLRQGNLCKTKCHQCVGGMYRGGSAWVWRARADQTCVRQNRAV